MVLCYKNKRKLRYIEDCVEKYKIFMSICFIKGHMHSHTDAHAPTKEQNKTIPNAVQKPFFN